MNSTSTNSPPADANVARFLPQRAAEQPATCALKIPTGSAPDGTIRYLERTFAELADDANRAAVYLQTQGIGAGTRTLLMVKPGQDLIALCFALFQLRAVPVVIDPGMGLKSFLNCVRRTQPEALVGIPLAHVVAAVCRQSFASAQARVVVKKGFVARCPAVSGTPDFGPAEVDELAAILFTSGSTGAPKGVCYTHGMFDAQVRMIRDAYEIEPGEVDLPMLPIFALFNPALGMTTVVPDMNPSRPATVDPAHIIQAIHQNSVTSSFGSPVLWRKVARYAEAKGTTFPTLRRVLMAGAPVPPALMTQMKPLMPNGAVHTPYGATECLPVSSIDAPTVLAETAAQTNQGAGTCVGSPLPGVEARIIAIEEGPLATLAETQTLEPGEIGEIIVTGPTVTRTYDRLPEATARAKIMDGPRVWHRMGDCGYRDERGRLWFCGRLVERVQRVNGPLYTDPVEGIFNQVAGVARSALIGRGERGKEVPAIVIEPEDWQEVRGVARQETFRARLHEIACLHDLTREIEDFFFVRRFPVDVRHNAKIHRLTLRQQFAECS